MITRYNEMEVRSLPHLKLNDDKFKINWKNIV